MKKIYKGLQAINPLRSLYAKIFLWFWLTNILLVIIVTFLFRQILEASSPVPADPRQTQILEKMSNRLEKQAQRHSRWQQKLARNRSFLIDMQDNMTGRVPKNLELEVLMQMRESEFPMQKRTANELIVGPKTVKIKDKEYQFFFWRETNKRMQSSFFSLHTRIDWWRIVIAFVVSIALCAILTFTIVSPIRKLREANQNFSKGDLKTRIKSLRHRYDELGLLARDFNTMAEKVEKLVEAQKKFLNYASHELRSPLTRMQVTLAIAEQSEKSWPICAERITNELDLLGNLIQQILEFSRLENELKSVEFVECDMVKLLDKLIDDVTYEDANKHPLLLVNRFQQLRVIANQQLITRAIGNVLRNAIKYSPENTQVTIELQHNDENIMVIVNDEGPGVDSNQLSSIFLPFVRKHSDKNGFGLGLAMVAEIIQIHGGKVTAKNLDKNGLSVILSLPIKNE
ncbi:MAG: ATP-binding protein [Pseudomonadota bacterium]